MVLFGSKAENLMQEVLLKQKVLGLILIVVNLPDY